jgi:integrase/recombinase XerD
MAWSSSIQKGTTMLKRLFPKIHARYAASAHGALPGDFAAWLGSAGYARHAAHGHVRRLKQALEGMSSVPLAPESGISVHSVSQAFASQQSKTRFQGTRRAFERFLAVRGHLMKEPDPSPYSPLVNRYREHLLEVRGLAASTVDQHIATIKRFLAQPSSAEPRTEAVAPGPELRFKDRLDGHLESRLHDPVLDRRDP